MRAKSYQGSQQSQEICPWLAPRARLWDRGARGNCTSSHRITFPFTSLTLVFTLHPGSLQRTRCYTGKRGFKINGSFNPFNSTPLRFFRPLSIPSRRSVQSLGTGPKEDQKVCCPIADPYALLLYLTSPVEGNIFHDISLRSTDLSSVSNKAANQPSAFSSCEISSTCYSPRTLTLPPRLVVPLYSFPLIANDETTAWPLQPKA